VTTQAATADLRGTEVLAWLERMIRRTSDPEAGPALERLREWRRGGSQRRDLDGDGVYEDSAAVALMDAWWPRLVRGIFVPRLGDDLVRTVSEKVNVLDARPSDHFFFDGWWGYVQKDVRAVLGRRVRGRLSRRYCGGGSRRRCRAVLLSTLRDAVAAVRREQGDDPAGWRVRATCPEADPPACDQVVPVTAGAIATPPIPFHNRGTFHQAVEVGGRRP
jgi:hypothetical protein